MQIAPLGSVQPCSVESLVIIFLDFDGVLHPMTPPTVAAPLFCRAPLLWKILEAVPQAEVVLSTTWRRQRPFEELVRLVTMGGGTHLAGRLLGATPELPCDELSDEYGSRERECLAWLYGNGMPWRNWIAIDDRAYWYSIPQPRLFQTDPYTGLTDDDVERIIAKCSG